MRIANLDETAPEVSAGGITTSHDAIAFEVEDAAREGTSFVYTG
jgi:hypothetical protein